MPDGAKAIDHGARQWKNPRLCDVFVFASPSNTTAKKKTDLHHNESDPTARRSPSDRT